MVIAGRRVQGAGIFPFDAQLLSDPQPPTAVIRTLLHDTWLGVRGTEVRGYKSGRWRFTPARTERLECPQCVGPLSAEGDWYFHHHAVGSLLHLHLGALPEVVAAFACPHPPSLKRPTKHG
jgi:cobyrinic acid a,c-diamide synthase